jgi:lipoprotein-anchoring transpeptidase ErfK/SrfK
MVVRISGVVLACLAGLPAGQALAQTGYPNAPRSIPESSYPADVPPGYYARGVVRRLPPGYYDDRDIVVIERRPYFGFGGYPGPYVRRYYRVAPGPYADDEVPQRPTFQGREYGREDTREYSRSAPPDIEEAPGGQRYDGRYAGLPPAAAPGSALPRYDRGPARPSYPPATSDTGPGSAADLEPRLRRQVVEYPTREPAGTIIVDTRNTYLYYVMGNGQAVRYGIGVGREGFTWSGTEKVSRMAEWPDWHPPQDMIERQPYLPRMMAGGPGNPLGARALYLGNTLYRIHGTNEPSTIGKFVSSGCIRLLNEDIEDLYNRVRVGTKVVVLRGGRPPASASAAR